MAKRSRFSGRSILLSLLVFLIALSVAVILLRENLSSILQTLYKTNYYLLPAALLAYIFGILVWSFRWHITLSTVGHSIKVRTIFVIIFGGLFINNLTPFTYAGGDPVTRTYILRKTQNVPYSSSFATILTEFVLDIPVYFTLLVLGLLLSTQEAVVRYLPLSVAIWVGFTIGWGLFFTRILSRSKGAGRIAGFVFRIGRFFRRRVSKPKIERDINRFFFSSGRIIRNKKIVAYVTSLTAIIWVMAIIRLYVLFLALGYSPPLHMVLLAVTLPAIAGMIPILPGGLGTVDLAIVSIFLGFGTPLEIAISATLLERSITLVFSTLAGAGAVSYLGVKYRNVLNKKQKSDNKKSAFED